MVTPLCGVAFLGRIVSSFKSNGYYKMKKMIILLFTVSLLAVSSVTMAAGTLEEGMSELAQEIVKNSMLKGKKSIAISSFPHTSGDISELSNYLADELVLKLFNVPESNLEIIERGQLNLIFQEMKLNMSGVVDVKTIQELGKVHGVGALVIGSITEMGETIRINARLTDTETGRVFSAAGTTIPKTSTTSELLSRILTVADNSEFPEKKKGKDGKTRSEPPKELVKKAKDLTFELVSCKKQGGEVKCELFITSDVDQRFYLNPYPIGPASRLFDDIGNVYHSNNCSVASSNNRGLDLIAGIRIKASVSFEGVVKGSTHIALLELFCKGKAREDFVVHFRKRPLK